MVVLIGNGKGLRKVNCKRLLKEVFRLRVNVYKWYRGTTPEFSVKERWSTFGCFEQRFCDFLNDLHNFGCGVMKSDKKRKVIH